MLRNRTGLRIHPAHAIGYWMTPVKDQIIAKLDRLPEPCLNEVLDVVDFLAFPGNGKSESLLSVAGSLSGEPFTAEQIEEALYGATGQGR